MPHQPNIPPYSPATLVTDLDNLRHNLNYFKSLLKVDTGIMAMVKADAYGCDAIAVSRALDKEGIQNLGVAYTQEGVRLRKGGIDSAIMVMNPSPREFPLLVQHQLEPEISSLALLSQWTAFSRKENLTDYPIHLELDTGMKRLGFTSDDLNELIKLLKNAPGIRIKSLYSHLASSPLPAHDDFTRNQFELFDKWSNQIISIANYSVDRHILNSAGIIRFPDHQYDMVRLGIGLYGVGLESLPEEANLRPVQSLYATISQIKNVNRQDTIGYERKGQLPSSGRIAILNIGYADGLPRLAGNSHFSVRIGDKLCPAVGSVCMDMTMIDVSECPEVKPGLPVEIYGEHHPVIHLAEAGQTIPYEILTANHQRLKKMIGGA